MKNVSLDGISYTARFTWTSIFQFALFPHLFFFLGQLEFLWQLLLVFALVVVVHVDSVHCRTLITCCCGLLQKCKYSGRVSERRSGASSSECELDSLRLGSQPCCFSIFNGLTFYAINRLIRGNAQSGDESTRGYHVLKVVPNSPADTAGLEPYFDYVLSINNIRLDQDNATILVQNVHGSLGVPVSLYVYSSKSQSVREVLITPSDWLGRTQGDGFVGCSVRFCDYDGASDHVWHILEVQPNSPAETAGLCPHVDYIIGTPHTTLKEKDDLYKLVEQSIGRPLQLFVYNTEWDSVREVCHVLHGAHRFLNMLSVRLQVLIVPKTGMTWPIFAL
ncbi:GRASP55/65 PDZ-like domain-containing protein [Cladochytrium replicatum]|nr:GRASP55/65 PDZ-like domain-containing protein [Cladochytrium replicatum]